MKILFMCVANSARSQLAEGLAKSIFGSSVEVRSAGSQPKAVHPLAVAALKEIGIDISGSASKLVDDLPLLFVENLDYVITLCAEEVCPVLMSKKAKKLHWPFPDPAREEASVASQMQRFREVRDEIKKQLSVFARETSL